MKPIRSLLVILMCSSFLTGCADRSKNEALIASIEKRKLVHAPGITLVRLGGSSAGGAWARLAHLDVVGELVSSEGSPLPLDLAADVATTIRIHLRNRDCLVSDVGQGGGISYTDASGVAHANLSMAHVDYSLQGADGRVDVLVIRRDYQRDGKKVVGQLIVTVNEAR